MLCRWPDPAGFMQSLVLDTAEVGPRFPIGESPQVAPTLHSVARRHHGPKGAGPARASSPLRTDRRWTGQAALAKIGWTTAE